MTSFLENSPYILFYVVLLGHRTGTYLLTPRSRVLLEKLTSLQLVKKFSNFMGPESLLPHSQVPAICPYPEPPQFSPYHHTTLPEDPF